MNHVTFFLFLQGLDLPEVLVEVEKRGSSFDALLTIPEQDDWVYSDGKSTSCIAYVLEMYKEAGLFDPIASSVQVTEFTVSFLRSLVSVFWTAILRFFILLMHKLLLKLIYCPTLTWNNKTIRLKYLN